MPVAGGVNQRPPSALEEQKDVFLIPGELLVILLPAMEQPRATLTGSFSFLDKTQTCISVLRETKTFWTLICLGNLQHCYTRLFLYTRF